MKKEYEAPVLLKIRFETEEKLMASVAGFDQAVDDGSVKLPAINLFG